MTISKYPSRCTNNFHTLPNTGKLLNAFSILQTFYLDKIGCFFKIKRPAVKSGVPGDDYITRHYFESSLLNTCTNRTEFLK